MLRGFAKRDTFAMSSKARRPLQPLAAEKATERLTFGCRAAPRDRPRRIMVVAQPDGLVRFGSKADLAP